MRSSLKFPISGVMLLIRFCILEKFNFHIFGLCMVHIKINNYCILYYSGVFLF